MPVAIRVDVEPLKLVDEIVFVDAKWTVRQFLDHVVAHLYTDLARDTLSLVRADSLAVLADSAALLDASVASNNVRFLVKRLQPAAPAPAGLYTQLPPVVQIGKPIYDIIPSLNDAIDRPAANANATAGATTTASAASSSSAVAADVRRRPDLPAKSGVEFTAPAAAAVVRAAIANRSSNDIDNNNNNNINVDDVAEPEKVRIVSGAFFEDLLSDLNAIEFEAAAAKRESGQFDVAAGFDALLNDAELCGDIEIDTQTIQTKKLNTLFDLIDEEDEAAAGTS